VANDSSWPDCSADCPANCPGSNPESNLLDYSENNLPSYSESYWADCPARCLGDYLDSAGRKAQVEDKTRYEPDPDFSPQPDDDAPPP